MNGGDVGSAISSQNSEPVAPVYYFYNPGTPLHSVDDNHLIDDALQAMKPLPADDLMAQQPGKKFVVEPLFVAMAGFVGIAMIFMGAVLFLPKILSPPPQVSSLKGPQELAALTKLAVETIEGKDCTERIACEVGRAMRSMQVGSKPIRVLEVLLPEHLAKQLAQIRKAVANKKACRLIQCKRLKTPAAASKTAENKLTKTDSSIELPLSKIIIKSTDKKEPRDEPDTVTVIAVKTKTEDNNSTSKSPAENHKTDKTKKSDKKSTKSTTSSPKINQTKTRSTEYPIILSLIPGY